MGPLQGIVVVEFAAIGPVPFCGQLLADLGAEVIVVERVDGGPELRDRRISGRSRRSVAVDLKHHEGLDVATRLVASADVLLEGHRPGVMERLGLGPEDVAELNPRLVYGRMTGWGREGPMAEMAGHDINYLSVIGALAGIGTVDRPIPPLNLVADYGGGAMYLAVGVLAALVERARSGLGQVVDAAMVDGSASLMDVFFTMDATGVHAGPRGTNFLDGGAPFYRTYATADGRWVAVGALEPAFYAELLAGLDLESDELPDQWNMERWHELADVFATRFATRTRDEWAQRFAGTDACVTAVLERTEAPLDAHNEARRVFVPVGETLVPAPAPRFGRSAPSAPTPPPILGADTEAILARLGYDERARRRLHDHGWVR